MKPSDTAMFFKNVISSSFPSGTLSSLQQLGYRLEDCGSIPSKEEIS
jgi:hypothetical protein